MTELERQLSAALQQLSTQYALDMRRLTDHNLHVQEQLQTLAQRLDAQSKQNSELAQSLQRLTDVLSEV